MSNIIDNFDVVALAEIFQTRLIALESLWACQVRIYVVIEFLDDDTHVKLRVGI